MSRLKGWRRSWFARSDGVIENLESQGLSILLVEQNLPLALRVSDQVHVLSRGRIVHSSAPQEPVGERGDQEEVSGLVII